MNITPHRPSAVFTVTHWVGIALLIIGVVTVVLGIGFDWSGFWGGMGLGAGIGSALVGTYLWGFSNGIRKNTRADWLPSEGTAR